MKISTITLNPAFDYHYTLDTFVPFSENYVGKVLTSAGGKGINVSRALEASGSGSTAVAVLGKDNSAAFISALNFGCTEFCPVYTDGRIRENITLHSDGVPETRISLDTFCIDKSALIKAFADADLKRGDIAVFAGRLPKGVTVSDAENELMKLKEQGVRLVVDCNSFSKETILSLSPWLIKPNEIETEQATGIAPVNEQSAAKAACILREHGAENAIVSLGKNGAVLACADGVFKADVPAVTPVSTVGAGDSTLAGFISAYAKGLPHEDSLAAACAFGTAACLSEGTNPPQKSDIVRILGCVSVRKL